MRAMPLSAQSEAGLEPVTCYRRAHLFSIVDACCHGNIMDWLITLDTALFRFINQSLTNPVFDWLMPRLAGHPLFIPAALVAGMLLLWKGGRRGRVFVVFLVLAIALGDGLVCNTIKKLVHRPRPCIALADTRALIGCTDSGSLPSSHAANWFCITGVCFVFYRRRSGLMAVVAAVAAAVSFSRVYDGVHYPSDVIAGAILGAGCAAATVWTAELLWRCLGRKWFPLWWEQMPSLLQPELRGVPGGVRPSSSAAMSEVQDILRGSSDPGLKRPAAPGDGRTPLSETDTHWLRLGYSLIAVLLLFRVGYVASRVIELSKDEAYQWLWSKHLALSYYSKPLGIAFIQFAGTKLWGDTQLGVRFFSPVCAAILSVIMLRFLARQSGGRQSFLLLLILTSAPLMGLGTILMTIDPPLVLFWTLAMIAGWRAIQPDGSIRHWVWAGVAAGLGFLCKYSALYLILCWGLFFLLWKPARVHLKKPGPYLAILILGLFTLPVVIWNWQHGWITVHHVAGDAGMGRAWKPTLRYFWEFLFSEMALLNPVFFVGALWAMAAFWKRRGENPLWLYFFCLGAPVFLGHLAWSLHSRVLPNWIAPAVVPMFCLMVVYWDARWREGARLVKGWLAGGLVFGFAAVVLMHQSNLIGKLAGHPLPAEMDPLRRVHAWKETSAVVEQAREKLLLEGEPAFIISDHYGMAGQFSFYIPEAKAVVGGKPLVYCRSSTEPLNQLYFWPEYRYRGQRTGQNAIYVTEQDPYPLEKAWPWKWVCGKEIHYARLIPPIAPPPQLLQEFESVTDLGVQEVKLGKRVFRRIQLFECHNLLP